MNYLIMQGKDGNRVNPFTVIRHCNDIACVTNMEMARPFGRVSNDCKYQHTNSHSHCMCCVVLCNNMW